jgi:hypothetical protein
MSATFRWLVPSSVWVRFAIVPALVFIATATDRNYLADFWHHLARGQAIVADGQLVNEDRVTFTVPGQEFQDVNWLTQVGYSHLFDRGGLSLVQLVNAILLAVTIALVVVHCRGASGSQIVATGVGLFTFFGLWQVLTIRPQTMSFFLFVVTYLVLEFASRWRWLLVLPPLLMALWANVHGAFPAGLMLIGAFLLAAIWNDWVQGERLLRSTRSWALLLCLFASALATLVNPYGIGIYRYVGLTSNRAAERLIDEWVPPSLDQWIGLAFFVSLALMMVLFAATWLRRGRRPTVKELCLCGIFLVLASRSVRMVAWWLLVTAPVAASLISDLLSRERLEQTDEVERSPGTVIVFGLIVLATTFCLPALQSHNPLLQLTRSGPRTEDDLEAVHQHMNANVGSGRIFSRFEWGEYLGWTCPPRYSIFMDGRIEIYPDQVWKEYTAVTCGFDDWQRILDRYQVNCLVLDEEYHAKTGLLARVRQSSDWERSYQSRDAVLYLRKSRVETVQR